MFLYVPLSHHSLPSTRFLCLIFSSPSPSTLVSSIFIPYLLCPYFSYSVHFLQPIPDRSDHPDPYHTPHLYKYTKYKLLQLSLIINFDTPCPSSAPPVNHGLVALVHLTPSSTCATFPTTQQSPLDKAQLKVMDAQRRPMPCPIPEPMSPSSGGHFLTVPDRTRTVTYQDRTAHFGLTQYSLNSLCPHELAKYKIRYL